MYDTILPRRARTSARIAPAADGLPYATFWPDTVSARKRGASDPMTELFGRQQKDLKQALERAEFAERIKANFLAHMSHEFRTPLNAIIGFSTLIRSGACENPDHIREYAAAIEIAGQQLYTMLTGILELAALEAEQVSLADDAIDLAVLIGCCIETVMSRASDAAIAVSVDIPADLPRVRGDRKRLRQVFDQILSNAVKFTPANGKIRVTVDALSGLAISVVDNGIGMAGTEIDRALAAFERVDGLLARQHGGAGIGLPLAAKLVELHGGRLSIESVPGAGTKVSIALPPDRVLRDPDGL